MAKKEKVIIGTVTAIIFLSLIVGVTILFVRYTTIKGKVEDFISKAQAGDLNVFDVQTKGTKSQDMDPVILELLKELDPKDPLVTGTKEPELTKGETIYQSILQHSKMDYSVSLFTGKVKFIIQAPDMENFIKNLNLSEVGSENDLYEKMQTYITSGKVRDFTAEMEYHKKDGVWEADYTRKDFLNAFTGGMQSGYNYLYAQMLEEYKSGMGE